jgi:hypothetical protein
MPTGGGGMQPQPTAERMHPYVWPGAPPGHDGKKKKKKNIKYKKIPNIGMNEIDKKSATSL